MQKFVTGIVRFHDGNEFAAALTVDIYGNGPVGKIKAVECNDEIASQAVLNKMINFQQETTVIMLDGHNAYFEESASRSP